MTTALGLRHGDGRRYDYPPSRQQPAGWQRDDEACEWFAEQVKERTNGRIEIQVYNNGTLGDAISCLEQLQYGGMDIVKADLSTMTNFVDEYNA